jgi:hypothetical protein
MNVKTFLFENYRLASEDIYEWVKSFDESFQGLNSETRQYSKRDDLHLFGLLINPNLERIMTSSSFATMMPFEANHYFNKEDEYDFYQLEYYAYMIREAVWYRECNKIQPLVIELNYYGENFVKDLKEGKFGEDIEMTIRLTLRQFESHFTLNIYSNFKLVRSLKTEDDLDK